MSVLPEITVGIPIHQAEPHLSWTILSIFSQRGVDWTAIAALDGCSDGSKETAMCFLGPRLQCFRNSEPAGLARNLNRIAELAQTPFVMRTDADDVLSPVRAHIQLSLLRSGSGSDVCSSNTVVVDQSNRPLGIRRSGQRNLRQHSALFFNGPIRPTGTCRKAWAERFRYEEQLLRAQDYHLWARALKRSKVIHTRHTLHFIREPLRLPYAKYRRTLRFQRFALRHLIRHSPVDALLILALLANHLKDFVRTAAEIVFPGGALTRRRPQSGSPRSRRNTRRTLESIGAMPLTRRRKDAVAV
jgi:glycosyltransferase involved in cell wall biosynthesis